MDALRLLCLLVMSFCFAEPVAGQTEKMLGKWSAAFADRYPRPLNNDTKCKVATPPIRFCDANEVLPDENSRTSANENITKFGDSTFRQILEIVNCPQPGVFVVALLKSIIDEAADKGKETVDIAKKFFHEWSPGLNNCSAVFVVSSTDKKCGLVLGDVLQQRLPDFNTTGSVRTKSSICFAENAFQGDITTLTNCLTIAFEEELEKVRATLTSKAPIVSKPSSTSSNSAPENRSSSASLPLIGNILFVLAALLLLYSTLPF